MSSQSLPIANKLIELLKESEAADADPIEALRAAGLIDDLTGR
jgi:hypothetical protein